MDRLCLDGLTDFSMAGHAKLRLPGKKHGLGIGGVRAVAKHALAFLEGPVGRLLAKVLS